MCGVNFGRPLAKYLIGFPDNTLSRRRLWSLWNVVVLAAKESSLVNLSWSVATVPPSATSSANTTCPCRVSPTPRERQIPNLMAATWQILPHSNPPWSLLFSITAWRRLKTEVFQRLDFTECLETRLKPRSCWKNSWLDEVHLRGKDRADKWK